MGRPKHDVGESELLVMCCVWRHGLVANVVLTTCRRWTHPPATQKARKEMSFNLGPHVH